MSDPVTSYRTLVADLVIAARRRDAAIAAATQSYLDGRGAVRDDLSAVSATVAATAETVAARELALVRVDQHAERIWADLRALRGRRICDLPASADCADTADRDSADLLASAAHRVARARRGGSISGPVLAVLPMIGAVAASTVALLASGLVFLGLPLAWLSFVVAPFTGLPFAARYVDLREGTRLDTGAIGLTVLGGMLAALTCAVLLN